MAIIPDQKIRQAFPCSQCGLCCQQVYRSNLTIHLDRGDGTCRHFDANSKSCIIYDQRPDICRVDQQFIAHYSSQYSWDEFIYLNMQVCKQLTHDAKDSIANPPSHPVKTIKISGFRVRNNK
ncbi:MAG: YkgJ family cysteine cluster protein [Brachymonas sp.]